MPTDLTATDSAAVATAMAEAYRLERKENARLQAELEESRAELRICKAELADSNRNVGQLIDERDHLTDLLDRFAWAVAPEDVIGEHSSMNCPWQNAIDLVTPMAVVDQLREELTRLRKENDDLSVGLGIPREPVIA
ncbi:hypothetical protein [Streptomyces sp. NPDC056670]|uniref:hypothetical protein n=1 Tax=Streptomyces sp. NPDC056670 TaxID=3345904 RepID=UPI0036CF9845